MFAVAYSPDAKTIATGSNDNIIRLWRADTREPLPELKGHFLGILDLAFTTDSRKLLSGSKDKTVRVWDVTTGVEEDVRRGHTDSVYAVAISGDRLATAADDGIRLWDLRSRAPVAVFPARSHGAQSLAFSLDGHYLAAGAGDGVVRVYEMQAEELVQLADTRVRRGWTNGECKQFLHRQFLPDIPCPRSRYSLLDEANQRFKNQELKDGERLLREAKGGGAADTELINAEVDARLGTALLWAANDAFERPAVWAEVDNSKKPEELAYALLVAAKEKSRDLMFDPQSRLNDLNAYKAVKLARELARADKLTESVAAFGQARAAGWDMPGEPERVASQLFALGVLSNPLDAEQVERALKLFPDIGPGHRLVAELYAKQNDFASAEKHYLEAASKESSAAPIASLAALSFLEYNGRKEVVYARKAAEYARKALDRDPGSDEAWVILGYAEYILKNEKKAVDAFDQVSPSSEFFADALNNASSIYFDDLGDDQTAYQRLRRAVELAPNDLMVLSSYAERLLASGRDGQAKVAATRRMSTLRPNAQTMPTFERR